MDQKQLLKQVIDLNQAIFNNIYSATVLVQDQIERVATAALDQVPGLPAEGRKVVDNWAEVFKKGRNNFKQQIDNSFEQAGKLFIVEK